MMLSKDKPDPGKVIYPDLREPMSRKIDSKVTGYILDGRVVFVQYNEDLGDNVSISMSEWDFGSFVEEHLMARVRQHYGKG
jgi:hypothetical protein